MTTAVPSIRDVKRGRAAWWDADQIGKPLTTSQAFWLRRGLLHRLPMTTARSLARRGLLAGVFIGQDVGLTPLGERVKRLLGPVPPQYHGLTHRGARVAPATTPVICQACGAFTPAELIAWGTSKRQCITCATRETP